MVEVTLDELPAVLASLIGRLQVAYHLRDPDHYVVAHVRPSGQRQELEYDVARARCLTDDERRAELPAATRTVLPGLVFATSYTIDRETSEKRVVFATDDGSVRIERAVHVPLVWDGAELIREALRRQTFPARYASLSRDDKILHWAGVIHRYRRAHGESGHDEDEVYTRELVRDLELEEPKLRELLGEILIHVGSLEQTPADEAIEAFTKRMGTALIHLSVRRDAHVERAEPVDRDDHARSETTTTWIDIAGGRFVLGLLPEEVDALTAASVKAARDRLSHDPDVGLRESHEIQHESGNAAYLGPRIARAFAPREVDIARFAIARSPVTNGEWKRFLAVAKLAPPHGWSVPGADADARAVIGVSWDEATQYASWIGAKLPSEAQWERAARGTTRRLFPWGDAWSTQGRWLDRQRYYDPWPRGAQPELASPDGVHDLITRRWEWCADAFAGDDAVALAELYPALCPDGRVRRGGFGRAIVACAVARTGARASWRADGTGFRLVK